MVVLWVIVVAPLIYISACSYVSVKNSNAFDSINVGDTEESVIHALGVPSVREQSGKLFPRYASHECQHPCVERLRFENHLSFDIEAWSVELDENDLVIEKAHWMSP